MPLTLKKVNIAKFFSKKTNFAEFYWGKSIILDKIMSQIKEKKFNYLTKTVFSYVNIITMKKLFLLSSILLSMFCLKAKRSPSDISNPSYTAGSPIGNLFILSRIPVSGNKPPVTTSPNSPVAPGAITPSAQGSDRMIPGQPVNFSFSAPGTVTSWSISPTTLPIGLTFNPQTGAITGTPDASYQTNGGFSLTTFTVTAHNDTASTNFQVPIKVLTSGENAWTVINGISGGDTKAGTNSMKYDLACKCLYIGGTTTANLDGQTIPSIGGNPSGFISKYDLDGQRIWTRVFGISGSAGISVLGLATDSSGNIYLTGDAASGNFNGITFSSGGTAGYIIKYDASGNVQWTTSSAPNVRHFYSGIVIDNSGDVVVTGTVHAGSIDGMTNTGWLDQALIIQKFNPSNGTRITGVIRAGSGSLGTDGYGVSTDPTGNIYIAGVSRAGSPNCGIGSTAYWRPVLFRFTSSLSFISCSFIPVNQTTFAFGSTATITGESYLSGYTSGSATVDSISPIGNYDGYFTKFDSGGIKQWTKRLGVSGATTAINSIRYESSTNNLYITGLTNGNLLGNIITGTRNMFVAKYDSSGNQIWLEMQGITNDTAVLGVGGSGTSIAFDSNGTLYSFGDTNGQVNGVSNLAGTNRSMFLVRTVQ